MSLLEIHLEKPAYKRVESTNPGPETGNPDHSATSATDESRGSERGDRGPDGDDMDDSTGRSRAGILILLLLLVGAAVAIRRSRA